MMRLWRTCISVLSTTTCLSAVGMVVYAQELLIDGLTPGKVLNRPVTIPVDKLRARGIEVYLNNEWLLEDKVLIKDGLYQLDFESSSGPAIAPIHFYIDTTPPEIRFTWSDGTAGRGIPKVDVVDEFPHPESLRLTLDGEPYDSTVAPQPGVSLFEATVSDMAGNTSISSELVEPLAACQPTTYHRYVSPQTTLSAAHYFPWHTSSVECNSSTNTYWCKCIWQPKGGLRPAPVFYGSNNQSLTNAQIDQIIAHCFYVFSV